MNRPIGIIGAIAKANLEIEKRISENDNVLIISNASSVDEIKQFRKFLLKPSLNRKVGIIHALNKCSEMQQAILLKIFEELPHECAVFFSASFMPSFTIQTRSEIIKLNDTPAQLKNERQTMLNSMKTKQITQNLKNAWKILLQTTSLFNDSIISEKEKSTILKGLGL